MATHDSLAFISLAPAVEDFSTRQQERSEISILTRRLASGDEAAFTEFHAAYFDRLYQFLLVVARGCEDEAREALQLTLLRVVRYARQFDSEEVFWDWLKMLGRSATRDAGRKARRYSALLQKFALRFQNGQPAPGCEDGNSLGAFLQESLEEMQPFDRQLIEGKYLEGETVRELCARVGMTEKAVESRLVRLRRQLRDRVLEKLRVS
jgi:RNA polymerase sigma-70 factor (ECF subfamily)